MLFFTLLMKLERKEESNSERRDALEKLVPVKLMQQSGCRHQNVPRSDIKGNYFQIFLNYKCTLMAVDMLNRGQTCPIQVQASHSCPIPTMCCLHDIIEADGGSHHICGTADDLEGKIVLGAALLVPTLVPGWLLACKGEVELQAMVWAPGGTLAMHLRC